MTEPDLIAIGFQPHGDDTLHSPGRVTLILFNTLVVRDGISVANAHAAFCTIDEYREAISPDAPGAEP